MKHLNLHLLSIVLMLLLSASGYAINLEDYYSYILNDEGGYKVVLTSSLKTALRTNKSYKEWTAGTALPNPAPDGMYNEKPVTDMEYLFYDCSMMTYLDLSNFDTRNVTDMRCMFLNCSKLTNLDVSNFDTSNVTNMNSMFSGCMKLTSVNISNFNTCNLTTMESMFSDCAKLTSLDLSNFDTSNVTNMKHVFNMCSELTSLDLSNFNTSNVTNMKYLFSNCYKLSSLDISSFDTSKITDLDMMFWNCYNLSFLDLSNFNTSKVTNMTSLFYNCYKLTKLDMHTFDIPTDGSVDISNIFYNCGKAVDGVPAEGIVMSKANAEALNASAEITKIDTSKLKFVDAAHSDAESVSAAGVKVFGAEGGVCIEAGDDVEYAVYGTDGSVAGEGTAVAGGNVVNVPQGVYVVKVGNDTVKVVVE